MIRAAEELDVDLLAVLGRSLAEPQRHPSAFELAAAGNVDGVIVMSPSIGFLSGPAGVAALLSRLGGVPAVSLSERMPGVSSVLVDNRTGMAALVQHMAAVHGRRRIAFVKGPPSSTEAEVRFRVYREELARQGLPFDPALVVEGDHWPASGVRAVRTLLDERRVTLDALLSSNDLMAIAAMEELRRRGLEVPADVAVAGFDDVEDAIGTAPPLTTVRQPLQEMGREAVRRVLALIRGEPAEAELELPAQLAVRQSCGCGGLAAAGPPEVRSPAEPAPSPEALSALLEAELPEMGARLGSARWSGALAAALPGPRDPGDGRAFLLELSRLLACGLELVPDAAPWFRTLRLLVGYASSGAAPEHASRLGALLAEATALVGTMAGGAERARRIRTEEEARVLHRMIQPFPLPDDAFIHNLLGALDVLGVRSFFLSRYLGADLREAALLVHHDLDGVVELEPPLSTFPAGRLVPGRFSARRRAHALLPIHSPDGPIGFALCEIGAMTSSGYEMLMHQITAVLSVNGLMAEVQDQHRQLLETARQAGMAEVAVGALHNVGNLLTSVNVSADEIRAAASSGAAAGLARATALLAEQAADLPGFFARDPRAGPLRSYLDAAVAAVQQDLARIQAESQELQEKTGLVRDSIRALQDHARGRQDHLVREAVELSSVVRSALEIQQAHLARWGVQVRLELEPLPPFHTQRSKLVHVLVNLVKNAVEAMRTTPEGKRLLRLRGGCRADGRIRLEVADSGEGIAPGDLERIFAYGFTTKRDGHGFGLYTCASYLKQLGGSIAVASEGPGRGATFTLLLEPGTA